MNFWTFIYLVNWSKFLLYFYDACDRIIVSGSIKYIITDMVQHLADCRPEYQDIYDASTSNGVLLLFDANRKLSILIRKTKKYIASIFVTYIAKEIKAVICFSGKIFQ